MNQICHFEIGCRDIAKTKAFYSKVFDTWRFEQAGGKEMIRTGADVGGHFNSLGHEPHHYITFYVMVADVSAALEKVTAAGGKKIVGPVPMDGGKSEFAWFADPEGNVVGIYAEAKK